MKTWITFCLFFPVVSILINTFHRISQIIKGPIDDSDYQIKAYQRQLRKLLIELGVMLVLLIGVVGILIVVWISEE